MRTIIAICAALLVISGTFAKGGGRGGGGRGGGSRGGSRGGGSGGSWFSWGRSKPAASPSYSSPSYSSPSYKSPSPPSYGWNTGGAPPAYPGLQNRPVHHSHSPPAYSPSYSNPPAYSGYNKYTRTYNYQPPSYGTQFGRSGVGSNTYIHNNYYGGGSYGGSSSGSNFLTNALFYSAGRHHGYSMGHPVYYGSGSRSWSERQDREWRATTQAPYFENKVPGGESVLPAAAVIGAATAFGLTTLLPLNVPVGKPLMYCNSTFIEQNPIEINDDTYSCMNGTIAISCPRTFENGTSYDDCSTSNPTLQCDLVGTSDTIYCTNGTLLSRLSIFCRTTKQFNTTVVVNGTSVTETEKVLNCNFGELPQSRSSFIPTTTTEAPVTTTTEKKLSLETRMHVFFLHLVGNSHVLDTTTPVPTTTTEAPLQLWIPEALTIPPEPTTTTTTTERTTTEPYYWAYKYPAMFSNGTFGHTYSKVPDFLAKYYEFDQITNKLAEKVPRRLIDTTEAPLESSTVTTEEYFESSSDANQQETSAQETSTQAEKEFKSFIDTLWTHGNIPE